MRRRVREEDNFVLDDRADEFCRRFNKFAERLSTGNLLLKSVGARSPTGGARNVTGTLARFANDGGNPDADFLREVASARIVCAFGDNIGELTKRFEEAKGSLLRRHAASAADIRRSSTSRPRNSGGERSLRAKLGSLDDLALAALRLRLRHIESHPDIVLDSGLARLLTKSGERGLLEPKTAEELAKAANFLLGLECILSLVQDGKPDEAQWEDSVKATVARACDANDFDDVVAMAEESAARIAAHLDTPAA